MSHNKDINKVRYCCQQGHFRILGDYTFLSIMHIYTYIDIVGIVYHLVIYMQSNKIHKLDIVGTVYHLVVYMQSNKIHKVF